MSKENRTHTYDETMKETEGGDDVTFDHSTLTDLEGERFLASVLCTIKTHLGQN